MQDSDPLGIGHEECGIGMYDRKRYESAMT
jgi:hypothetical protein